MGKDIYGTYHWIIVALFGLSLLCGIGYSIINIMLTGRVSNTLMWFLPLSGVIALLAWVYARRGSSISEIFDTPDEKCSIADRVLRWAPLVPVAYILIMYLFLPTKVKRMMWTDDVIESRYETVYLMGYDMTAPNGSTTRHYLQAGEHYLANETPFTMVSYEVLYGKDDGRKLECKRFEPYSIDIGRDGSREAPKYNVPDEVIYARGRSKQETYVGRFLWFERGKKHITLLGLHPYSTLIIARSSYAPDVEVEGIADNIVVGKVFDEKVQMQKKVIDTYYMVLGKY